MNERKYYSQEAEIKAKREATVLMVLTLSVGIGIGSILALLFAPTDGENIRENLSDAVEKRMGTVEKQVNELRNRVEDRISEMT